MGRRRSTHQRHPNAQNPRVQNPLQRLSNGYRTAIERGEDTFVCALHASLKFLLVWTMSLRMVLSLAANHAYRGIQNGTAGLVSGAQKTLDGDVVRGSIDQALASQQVEASAAVLRAVDESLGTLLDDLA